MATRWLRWLALLLAARGGAGFVAPPPRGLATPRAVATTALGAANLNQLTTELNAAVDRDDQDEAIRLKALIDAAALAAGGATPAERTWRRLGAPAWLGKSPPSNQPYYDKHRFLSQLPSAFLVHDPEWRENSSTSVASPRGVKTHLF